MNDRPAPSAIYDWSMAIASLWCSGGILLDAWYHFHSNVETFFEPAHGLLYLGLLAAYVFTAIALVASHRRGFAWNHALPKGYETTIAGLIVFLAGGVLDMIKHSLWGFEEGFNALLSPTHLLIGAGMFLIIAGPVRSAIEREHPPRSLVEQLPMLLALASMIELIHWGTQFVFLSEAEHMNAPLDASRFPHDTLTLLALLYYKEGIGLLAVIVQSLLMAGFALYAAQRIRLAAGAVTVLLVVGNIFIAAVTLASLLAGVFGDAIGRRWRLFAFGIPAIYWAVLLGVLAVTMGGLWWSPDVIAGSVLFAGFAGLFTLALTHKEQSPSP
jgi:hypothetical protein